MPRANVLKPHTQDIITQYVAGSTTVNLGRLYECSDAAIWHLLKRNGVTPRPRSHSARKYTWDDTFFDTIDSQEKAYILGFFYADGCNHSSSNRWIITCCDRDILEEMKICLKSNYVLEEPRKKERGTINGKVVRKYQQQYTLRISSPNFCKRMTELGAPPRKTFLTRFPTPEQIPSNLIRHFLRGLLDGDGYIVKGGASLGWCGTEDLLRGVARHLADVLGVHCSVRAKGNIWEASVAGRYQAKEVTDYLYDGATICLDRKRSKSQTTHDSLEVIP